MELANLLDPHDQEKCENPEKCDLCMVSNIGIRMRTGNICEGTLVCGQGTDCKRELSRIL